VKPALSPSDAYGFRAAVLDGLPGPLPGSIQVGTIDNLPVFTDLNVSALK
jgi:hypothetical protein